MSVDERSLYTLQLTTEAMAHEISHFVGRKGRCRDIRKACIVKCVLHDILIDLAQYVAEDILSHCPLQNYSFGVPFAICHHRLSECVDRIWTALETLPEFSLETDNYGDQIQELIYNLPDILSAAPDLNAEIVKQVTRILFDNEKVKNYMIRYAAYEAGAYPEAECPELSAACWRRTAEYKIQCSIQDVLDGYALELQKLTQETSQEEHDTKYGKIYKFRRQYEAFRETFADLQAILIFNIKWPIYCRLLKRKNEPLAQLKDIPNRIVAVGRVLTQVGFWSKNEICAGDPELRQIEQAILLPEWSPESLTQLDQGLSYILLHHLEPYLGQCYSNLERVLNSPDRKPMVARLRKMHDALSKENSVLDLCVNIMEFINFYRDSLLKQDSRQIPCQREETDR